MRYLVLLTLALPLCAQRLSLGIVAAGSPTDAFQNIVNLSPQTSNAVKAHSPGKDFLIGPSLEVRLTRGFSIEADALFRQLHLTQAQQFPGEPITPFGKTPVVTWEIPVLAKYRLSTPIVRTFLEGGPSFRTTGNLNDSQPSHAGVTAGIGLELQLRKLKISPAIRYTRWRRDDPRYSPTITRPEQIELIVGFSAEAASHWKPLGEHAALGVIFGTNFSSDVAETAVPGPAFRNTTSIYKTSGAHRLIVGPSVTFQLPRNFSLEFDALYRQIASLP